MAPCGSSEVISEWWLCLGTFGRLLNRVQLSVTVFQPTLCFQTTDLKMGQCSISILYLPRLKNTPSLGWSRCMTASCQKKDRKRYYVSVLSSMGTESIHPSIHPSSHSSQVTLTHTFRASNQPVFVGLWEEAGVSGENPPRLGENMLTLHGMIGVGTERTALLPHGDRVFRGTTVLPVFWVIEFYLRWAWGLTCMSGGVTQR